MFIFNYLKYLNHPMLVTEDGQNFTYEQIYNEIIKISHLFERRQIVFFAGSNDITSIKIYLSIFEANAVPLLLDPNISTNFLFDLLFKYSPRYIFIPISNLAIPKNYKVNQIIDDYVLYENINNISININNELALLMLTSGSTGSSKLVRVSFQNILSNTKSIVDYLGIKSNDRTITSLPINYSYGISIINSHFYSGASIVLTKRSFIDKYFWSLMNSYSVTSLGGVPYSYDMLIKLKFLNLDLPSLKTLTQAGGRMNNDTIKKIHKYCQIKNIRFFIMYGQTEASPRISFLDPLSVESKMGSIGKAIPGGRLWIENENNQEIDYNVVGELVYSGPNVALGYANNLLDLARGDDWNGVLRTGDLARKDEDGYFFIEGRISRFIKLSGIRYSLESIELWFINKKIIAAAYGKDDHLRITIEANDKLLITNSIKLFLREMRINKAFLSYNIVKLIPRLNNGKINYQYFNGII